MKEILSKKSNQLIALVLMLAMITGLVFAVNSTLAAPNDITVTLTSPNTYREIEKGTSYTVITGGTRAIAVNKPDIASAQMVTGGIQVTGIKAGAVTIAGSAVSGLTVALNYQITDSSNISAYILKDGGEVVFSGPGSTKNSPLILPPGVTGNIEWSVLQPSIATVNATTGAITAVSKGTTLVIGKFVDKWGVNQDMHILVGVGTPLSDPKIGELLELIKKAEDILAETPKKYTDKTLADLQDAVNKGKDALDNPTDSKIQTAIDDLKTAIANLKEKVGPIEEIPTVVDGGILKPDKTGDTSDWIEIARNGAYSLIIRKEYININAGHAGEPNWQFTPYGATPYTNSSNVRSKINAWFNITGAGDNLAANARLRQYTVNHNAAGNLGTVANLTAGFSKPTTQKISAGNDIAFALSYSEAANFCSNTHDLRNTTPEVQQSNAAAKLNFAKINIPVSGYFGSNYYDFGAWLRSAGDVSGTMGALSDTGRTFQFFTASAREAGLVYPALWVETAIFD